MKTHGQGVGWGIGRMLTAVVMAGSLAGLVACSSEQPKPMPQPTPDQVKGHSERGFDRLKQEERERKAVGQ